MSSIRRQVKQELSDAARGGILEYLSSTRGANLCGAAAEVYSAGMPKGTFLVRCPNVGGGNSSAYFEVKITEKL